VKTHGLLAALSAAALVAAGCGGGEPQASYRDVLIERYAPLARSLDAAVEPCQAEDLSACRTHSARALDAARTLLDRLDGTNAPNRLEEADRQFRRSLRALVDNLERTLAAIDAGDDDKLASLRWCCSPAGANMTNAVGDFNEELDLDLRQ
jgi:hypothetical protein